MSTPPDFIANQYDLLQAIADGGALFRTTGGRSRTKDEWWLKREGQSTLRVLSSAVRAAERKKLVEPTGALYWRITNEGQAALAKRPARPRHHLTARSGS